MGLRTAWNCVLVLSIVAVTGTRQRVAGQEALRTALESDAAARMRASPPVRPRDDMLRIGPVNLDIELSYSLEASDNVRHTDTDRHSDLIQRPSANIGLMYQLSPQSQFDVRVGIGYEDYIDNTVDDRFFVAPDSEVALDIRVGENGVLTLYDRFEYSQDVIDEGALSGVARLPRLENVVGLRSVWRFEEVVAQAGYSHLNVWVLEDESEGNQRDFSHLERADEQFFGRVGYRLHPIVEAGLEATTTLSAYTAESQRDRRSISVGPYLELGRAEALQVGLRGGAVYTDFEATNSVSEGGEHTSFYARLQVDHQLTEHVTLSLSAGHEVRSGINTGSDYIETTDFAFDVSWTILRHLTLEGRVYGELSEEVGVDQGVIEEYSRIGFLTGARYNLTERLSFFLRYAFATRDSDTESRRYTENRVTIGANYRF